MNEALIYDFEGITEKATSKVLKDLGFDAFSLQDLPTLQKPRPRFEVKYVHGSGLSRFVPVVDGVNCLADPAYARSKGLTPGDLFYYRRESAWACTIKFTLITAADIQLHTNWRTVFRDALAQLWVLVNGVDPMTRHTLQMTKDAGNNEMMPSTDKALYRTDFLFEGLISINADAWSVLTAEQQPST